MNQLTCPSCGALTTDGLLCARETTTLEANLTALPGLLRELETNLTRQNKAGEGSDKVTAKDAARPLPYDVQASEVADIVKDTLLVWVNEMDGSNLSVGGSAAVRALATYLLRELHRLRGVKDPARLVDEIGYCVGIIRRAIDTRPERIYLGPCPALVDGKPCGKQLYAPAGSPAYDCPECKTPMNVAERKEYLLGLIAETQGTQTQCAQILATFNLEVKMSTIENWVKPREDKRTGVTYPPKLWSTGVDAQNRKLYRLGDVSALAKDSADRAKDKADRAAKRKQSA